MPTSLFLPDLKDSRAQRQTMVDCQIRTFDVTDQPVIERFLTVPRERFLPESLRDLTYSDTGLTIPASPAGGGERYCLPPFVLARLIQGGRVSRRDRVLDIASGFGYSSALLAGLAGEVVSLESAQPLREEMTARLGQSGFGTVRVIEGPLEEGSAADAPFDVIMVNGAVERGLEALFAQLREGGRLLAIQRLPSDPTGRAAKAMRFDKNSGEISNRVLFDASGPVLAPFKKAPAFIF